LFVENIIRHFRSGRTHCTWRSSRSGWRIYRGVLWQKLIAASFQTVDVKRIVEF
jgi:hypothetical protein